MQHGACRPIVGRGFSSRWVGGALHQARLSSAFRQQRQFHVAIVGSGPAGFYTTKFLFKHAGEKVKVDMFERLPTPFGLVRFGVAPDHPEVKNVINDFTTIAASPQFRFFGNVEIGADVTLRNLEDAYDAVVLCMGAQGERILKIPGEDMRGVVGAPAFVKWYNGHPDYSTLSDELPESVGAEAVVVGNGNVALDVARLLARSPAELRATDMLEGAIQRIATWQSNGLRTLHVLGRRGVVQAAFTNKELRELLHISDDVLPIIDPEEVELSMNAASKEELTKNRPKKRAMEIIDKMVDNFSQRETTSKRLVWLHFLAAPKEIIANGQPTPSCSGMLWSRMRLTGEPGRQSVEGTGEDRKIDCGLVVRSVGFDLTPIDGVPINERKRIPHQHGRVQEGDDARRSLYVSGWLKRGPTGVIASNIPDAQETATAVYKDLVGSGAPSKANPGPVEATLAASGVQRVSFADWRKLQEIELQRGAEAGRAAVKLTDTAEMLKLLSG